jgi:hypothetical protein
MSTTATTTELADQARHLATEAADLHRRLHRTYGTQGPTDASAAGLALDRLASELAAHPDPNAQRRDVASHGRRVIPSEERHPNGQVQIVERSHEDNLTFRPIGEVQAVEATPATS